MLNKKRTRVRPEAQYGLRTAGEILHDYLENSNDPLAVAYRIRLFRDLHPQTELGVDLKLLTCEPGRMPVGTYINGTIARDSEDHFSFYEQIYEKKTKRQTRRNAHLYEGTYVNVNMRGDGVVYPTIRYGKLFNKSIGIKDFCLGAAQELLTIASLLEKR